MEEIKPDLPILDDETYALIRRYLFGNSSTAEWDRLENLVKDIDLTQLTRIIIQLKKETKHLFISTT